MRSSQVENKVAKTGERKEMGKGRAFCLKWNHRSKTYNLIIFYISHQS